jgi:hypothetical protein
LYLLFAGDSDLAEKQPVRNRLIVNLGILLAPFLLAMFYPNVGPLESYLSSFATLFTIYLFPTLVKLNMSYNAMKTAP